MKSPSDAHRIRQLKLECTVLARQLGEARARQLETEAERDKAEQALRSVTLELSQARTRLRFVEAELASFRPERVDDS